MIYIIFLIKHKIQQRMKKEKTTTQFKKLCSSIKSSRKILKSKDHKLISSKIMAIKWPFKNEILYW